MTNEATDKHIPPESMIDDMIETFDALNMQLKTAIGAAEKVDDYASADLLTGILAQSEKFRWMFKSVSH